ncbi:MAG: hypothetical protein ACRCU1_03445 [Alsobacter sp.]
MSGLTLKVLGESLAGTWPALSLIEAAASKDADKLKALAKAAFPGLAPLLVAKKQPMAYAKAGLFVLLASGAIGPLEVIGEDELPEDDEAVKPWADAQKKFEDATIHLVRYVRKTPSFDARFLLREPREREIDAYLKNETFEGSREFAKKLCVWGDIDALANHAPALPRALLSFLLDKAGLNAEIELGEA